MICELQAIHWVAFVADAKEIKVGDNADERLKAFWSVVDVVGGLKASAYLDFVAPLSAEVEISLRRHPSCPFRTVVEVPPTQGFKFPLKGLGPGCDESHWAKALEKRFHAGHSALYLRRKKMVSLEKRVGSTGVLSIAENASKVGYKNIHAFHVILPARTD